VSLIVLQIRAQKQQLTTSELNNLGRLKKNMGKLLEMIRESGVASVVAFGLSNLTKAANAVQILEAANSAAETCSDDTSSISATSTILNPSLDNFNSAKKESVLKSSTGACMNANNHTGLPQSSNLCTLQNQRTSMRCTAQVSTAT
jgi:hypothetical protein